MTKPFKPFCTVCGRQMKIRVERAGYRQANGEPKYDAVATCPTFLGRIALHPNYVATNINPEDYKTL